LHIEFIGLPGAGKTTLRKRLLSSLQQDGDSRCISSEDAFLETSKDSIDWILRYPLRYLPHSIALSFSRKLTNRSRMQFEAQNQFIAGHGAALNAFLASVTCLRMSNLDRQRVIGSFLSMGALWQCTSTASTKNKVVFFEEGLVQKSFMFVDHSQRETNDKDKILRYLENIPHADLVIHVSASIQTSWSRMLSRPDGLTDRLKHADDDTIGCFLRASRAHLDVVTEWLTENRREHFVILNVENDIASEFDAIKDKVRQLKP